MFLTIFLILFALFLGFIVGVYFARRTQESFIHRGTLYVHKTPGGKVITFDIGDEDPEQLDKYSTVALTVVQK